MPRIVPIRKECNLKDINCNIYGDTSNDCSQVWTIYKSVRCFCMYCIGVYNADTNVQLIIQI